MRDVYELAERIGDFAIAENDQAVVLVSRNSTRTIIVLTVEEKPILSIAHRDSGRAGAWEWRALVSGAALEFKGYQREYFDHFVEQWFASAARHARAGGPSDFLFAGLDALTKYLSG